MAVKINGNTEVNVEGDYEDATKNANGKKEDGDLDEKKDCDDGEVIQGGGVNSKKKISRASFLLYAALIYIGVAIIVMTIFGVNIVAFIERYYPSIIGLIFISIGTYNVQGFFEQKKRKSELKFTDVDRKYNRVVASNVINTFRLSTGAENNEISNANVLESGMIDKKESKAATRVKREEDTFITYFKSMKVLIERKASAADEKASILLEKGTSYTKFGIIFYLLSILIWQFIFWKQGFKVDFAWGIASCSFLFLFIEFLSAWFLKQYKNFTDTSTYLIKVKSTLDRYMLMYMIGFENKDKEIILMARKALLEMLSEEIQWPDTKTINNNDNGYAKDALASLSDAIKSMSEGMHANKNKS
ncbi:hypothetical protein [Serratia proteamaculans]|uniref:hypothetical protein n=1 Tax=Serratia proteamaculans TaxID=28151 RepID=UPI00101F6D3D|nr:hypothetical protein [Serratia proteamaculans]